MSKPNILLKVSSILFIIGSVITIVGAIISVWAVIAAKNNAEIPGGLFMYIAIVLCLNGVIELLTGIFGLKANNMTICTIFAIIVLGLSAVTFIASIVEGSVTWTAIIGIALPLLYFLGVKKQLAD